MSEIDFSMRMDSDDSIPEHVLTNIKKTRPDTKGPKTLAVIMIIGAILIGFIGYGNWSNSNIEDLNDSDVEEVLTAARDAGENVSNEDYQKFHDDARESGAYTVLGWSLMISSVLLLVGGVLLFRLNKLGTKLGIAGSTIAFSFGMWGQYQLKGAAQTHLSESLAMAYELQFYLCGVCMFACGMMSALPLLTAGARAALDPVKIYHEEE